MFPDTALGLCIARSFPTMPEWCPFPLTYSTVVCLRLSQLSIDEVRWFQVSSSLCCWMMLVGALFVHVFVPRVSAERLAGPQCTARSGQPLQQVLWIRSTCSSESPDPPICPITTMAIPHQSDDGPCRC